MASVGKFVGGVGAWWLGAPLLFLAVAGAGSSGWRGLFTWVAAAVGLLMVLLGAYGVYRRTARERDELRLWSKSEERTFTVAAAVPYAERPVGVGSLVTPDVHVVNWSNAPIDLAFNLVAANGLGSFGTDTAWGDSTITGNVLPNPMHLEPRSCSGGRLVWQHGGQDVERYVIAGVVLRVVEAASGLHTDIPLPTSPNGFDVPDQPAAT